MISNPFIMLSHSEKPCAIGWIWILQCPGNHTIRFAVTFSVFNLPTSPQAAPLAPMSGSLKSHEVEAIRAQEPFASEMASPVLFLFLHAHLSWKPLIIFFSNAVYVPCIFLSSFYLSSKWESRRNRSFCFMRKFHPLFTLSSFAETI